MTLPSPFFRFWPIVLLLAVVPRSALAARDPRGGGATRVYAIPAGPAVPSLWTFAAQSGEQLLYSADVVRNVRTQAVFGKFTALHALQAMLLGTGLVVWRDAGSGALGIGAPAAPPSSAPSGATSPLGRMWRQIPAFTPEVPGSALNDRVVRLTPFEVAADPAGSYGARETSALTAFSVALDRLPATTDVFTDTFIQDTNSLTVEGLLLNYAGIAGYNTGDSGAFTLSPGDRDGGGGLSLRGFTASSGNGIKRDGFFGPPVSVRTSSGATPTFDLERVEVVEGPQSLLYGAVGGGGVVNAVSKRAEFGLFRGSMSYTVDDLGSKIGLLDVNAGGEKLAIRLAATAQENHTDRLNLGDTVNGLYLQAAVRLGAATVARVVTAKTETVGAFSFKPSLKNFVPRTDPRFGEDGNYLALTGDAAALLGEPVSWQNFDSLAGWWSGEAITNTFHSLVVESAPLPWLSVKLNAMYDEMTDWRNFTSLTLQPPGAAGNPYPSPALQVGSPNLNFQSQRQKAAQLSLVWTQEFAGGAARSQTLLGAYANHLGPTYGSSGIEYRYFAADPNWNLVPGSNLSSDYGRTMMPALWIPVAGGQIVDDPLFRPGEPRVTLAGQNYVLQPRILQNAAYKSPANPYALVPNTINSATGAPGYSGLFNTGVEEHEQYLSLANYTDWFRGRLQTLAGVSFDRAITQNTSPGFAAIVPWKTYSGYEFGAIFQFLPTLGFYANYGTAATPVGSTADLFGRPLAPPRARTPSPEIGLKYHTRDGRYSAQLSWDIETRQENDLQAVDGSYLNAVNPNGINGRAGSGAANTFVNLDHSATAAELSATAEPAAGWRFRLSAAYLFERVETTVSYPQLYNDQFRADPSGQVTYANGTPVLVDGTGIDGAAIVAPGAPGAIPLTTALIGDADPTNPYYATPDPTSGSIGNAALRTILTTGGPPGSVGAALVAAHGAPATGATGLPLTAIQYPFTSPFAANRVTLFPAGQPTTGYNGVQLSAVADGSLPRGAFRGLGLHLEALGQFENRAYFVYYPSSGPQGTQVVNETRLPYGLPPAVIVNAGLRYTFPSRGRIRITTRVSVSNLFNHDPLLVVPEAGNGTLLQVVQRSEPRLWMWSSEIDF